MKQGNLRRKKIPVKAELFSKEDFQPKPYPIELLASIATQVLVAGHFIEIRECLTSYDSAVRHATMILDACQREIDSRDVRAENLRKWHNEKANLSSKYPDGMMPYLKGLLYITEARTEGEGLPIYKRWLMEGQETLFPAKINLTEDATEKFVIGLRSNGLSIHGIQEIRNTFQQWKKVYYLPAVKKQSGTTPKKQRRNRRTKSKIDTL